MLATFHANDKVEFSVKARTKTHEIVFQILWDFFECKKLWEEHRYEVWVETANPHFALVCKPYVHYVNSLEYSFGLHDFHNYHFSFSE